MNPKLWEDLLLYKLEGARFDAHEGVQLRDLRGLADLHDLLLELAKADFKARLGRERSPKGAEELFDVRIRGFEDGCIQFRVLLGREAKPIVPKAAQGELFPEESGPPPEPPVDEEFLESVHNAARLAEAALAAAVSDETLPQWMPNDTFARLKNVFSASVRTDEVVTIQALRKLATPAVLEAEVQVPQQPSPTPPQTVDRPPTASPEDPDDARGSYQGSYVAVAARGRDGAVAANGPAAPDFSVPHTPTPVDKDFLSQLGTRAERERSDREAAAARAATRVRVLEGEVRMVDVDGKAVRLRLEGGHQVRVVIGAAHEREVTRALDKHDSARLRVRGDAIHNSVGLVRELRAERVAIIEPLAEEMLGDQAFERLAREDPAQLINLLVGPAPLAPHLLTYAAEIAGRSIAGELVVDALLALLRNENAFVREGAVLGLAAHVGEERVVSRLNEVQDADPSPGVRTVAADTLKAVRK